MEAILNKSVYTEQDKKLSKADSKRAFRIYWECLKPSKYYIIASFIFMLLDATFELLIPFLAGLLLSMGVMHLSPGVGLDQGAMYWIWLFSGLMIGLAFLAICAQTVAMRLSATISSDFTERLRNTLFWKVEEYSFSNIGKFPVAKLTTLLSNDCNNVRMFVLMLMRAGFKSPLIIIVSLIFLFALNWLIALIVLPLSLMAFAVIAYASWSARPQFVEAQAALDVVNSNVEEDTEGIREVKAFCREKHMNAKFAEANRSLTSIFYRAAWKMSIVSPVTQFAISIIIGAIQYLGGWSMIMTSPALNSELFIMFNNGRVFDAGELSMLANFTAALTMAFSFLSMLVQFYGRCQASKARMDRVLLEKVDISYVPKPRTKNFNPNTIANGDVEFKNVVLTYVKDLKKAAVGPLNIKVPSGKVIGIIGGTGSGKSSMVNLIPRLYDASMGQVLVGGHNVKDYSLTALRNDIGVVLQQNVLFTGTIRSNVLWGDSNATDEKIWEALDIAQASEFVHQFNNGLDTLVAQGGKSVSGGQKQRLCIARAVIKKPKILILDDSTSACDMHTEREIKKQLFTQLQGTTIFIIAQRIASVKDADMILVLDNGRVVGLGQHKDLLKSCRIYQEIDAIQKKGVE